MRRTDPAFDAKVIDLFQTLAGASVTVALSGHGDKVFIYVRGEYVGSIPRSLFDKASAEEIITIARQRRA